MPTSATTTITTTARLLGLRYFGTAAAFAVGEAFDTEGAASVGGGGLTSAGASPSRGGCGDMGWAQRGAAAGSGATEEGTATGWRLRHCFRAAVRSDNSSSQPRKPSASQPLTVNTSLKPRTLASRRVISASCALPW